MVFWMQVLQKVGMFTPYIFKEILLPNFCRSSFHLSFFCFFWCWHKSLFFNKKVNFKWSVITFRYLEDSKIVSTDLLVVGRLVIEILAIVIYIIFIYIKIFYIIMYFQNCLKGVLTIHFYFWWITRSKMFGFHEF